MVDHALLEKLALEALAEIAPAGSVGERLDEVGEGEGVVTLHFASVASGYPGWRWTVSLSAVEDLDPTVLEAELLPGDGALLAPDWVPWADRLEEYRAAQAAAGESGDDEDEDSDDDSDDEDSDDDDLDLDDLEGDDADEDLEPEESPEESEEESDNEPEEAEASAPPVAQGDHEQHEPAGDADDAHPEPRRIFRRPRRRAQG